MTPTAFLSYNWLDRSTVARIAEELQDQKVKVFFDRSSLAPGRLWLPDVHQAIGSHDACVVFLGANGLGRTQAIEIQLAFVRLAREPSFRIIPVLLPGHDPQKTPLDLLEILTWVDFTAERPNNLKALRAAIAGETIEREAQADISACLNPYRGLLAFRQEDARLFFGREALSEEITALARERPFVGIVGASGTGKSSLVKAGVLARLCDPAQGANWTSVTIRPRDNVFLALAEGLAPLIAPQATGVDLLLEQKKLADYLRNGGPDALIATTAMILQLGSGFDRLVLVIDQLEELFTLSDDRAVTDAFIAVVARAAAAHETRLHILATMRSDQYQHITDNPYLGRLFAASSVSVQPMTRGDLERAIVEPAGKLGVRFESGLPERIVDDMQQQTNALPLLQYLLEQVFSDCSGSGLITHAAYKARGGVKGAIAQRADTLYRSLPSGEQEALRALMLRLVKPGEGALDSKQPARRDLLDREAAKLVEKLTAWDTRLLAADGDRIEIAHEALIREWQELRKWIDDKRKELVQRGRLSAQAERWHDLEVASPGRGVSLLLPPGLPLAEGRALLDGDVTLLDGFETVRAFIKASIVADDQREQKEQDKRARERRQRNIAAIAAVIFVTLAGVTSYLALNLGRQVERAETAQLERDRTIDVLRSTVQQVIRTLDGVTSIVSEDLTRTIPGIEPIRKNIFSQIVPSYEELNKGVIDLFGEGLSGEVEQLRAINQLLLINLGQTAGATLLAEAGAHIGKLLAAYNRRSEGDPDRLAIAEMIYATGYSLTWRLLDLGLVAEAVAEAGRIVKSIDSNAAANGARASFFRERGRFLNALARIARAQTGWARHVLQGDSHEWLNSPAALGDAFLRNAGLALERDPSSAFAKELEAIAQINRNLDMRQPGKRDEGFASLRQGCSTVAGFLRSAPYVARYISLDAHCAVEESYQSSDLDERLARLVKAEQSVRFGITVSPDDIELDSDLLNVLSRLTNLSAGVVARKDFQERYARLYLEQLTRVMERDDRLPPRIEFLGDQVSYVQDLALGGNSERMALLRAAFNAVKAKQDRYRQVRPLAEATARLGAVLVGLLREGQQVEEAIRMGISVAELVEGAGLLDGREPNPQEAYATYCGAFSNLMRAYIAKSQLDDARTALNRMRALCAPLLARQPWDFYLRDRFIDGAHRLALAFHTARRFSDALPELEYASHWGSNEASRVLAEIYAEGRLGSPDAAKTRQLKDLAGMQSVRRFAFPVDFAGVEAPFHVYVREWPSEYPFEGIDDQIEWVKVFRGGTVPDVVRDFFRKHHRIARDNRVSFADLVFHVFNNLQNQQQHPTPNQSAPLPPQ